MKVIVYPVGDAQNGREYNAAPRRAVEQFAVDRGLGGFEAIVEPLDEDAAGLGVWETADDGAQIQRFDVAMVPTYTVRRV